MTHSFRSPGGGIKAVEITVAHPLSHYFEHQLNS